MKNNYRDDGIVWSDDQICEMADLLIGVQGIRFVYLKKRDRSWIYRLGDDEMRYAFLQMTEMQLRIIEELLFEDKTITDILREFDLTISEIRKEVMRMGEINALTPDCIDFENNVIHVSATISKGVDSKSFVKEGTKTETGVRDVPISNTLRPYLEEALKKYRRNKQKLLFYDHNTDKVITTNQVNSYYKRIFSCIVCC